MFPEDGDGGFWVVNSKREDEKVGLEGRRRPCLSSYSRRRKKFACGA